MTETTQRLLTIMDDGIESGLARFDEKKVREIIHTVIHKEASPRLEAYLSTCVHCGLCSDSCHYYLSRDKDPAYSPAGKVKKSLLALTRSRKITPEILKEAAIVAFTHCNLCRRCTLYCPLGVDIAYLIAMVRRICFLCGVVPHYIQDTANSHSATFNQMWIKNDEWLDSLYWQEEEAREELPDLTIPVEREGAEIMYSVIGPEPKFRAQLIYQAAVIMDRAGISWTYPGTRGWDNSDMCMYTGDYEMMGRLKKAHFDTAMRLKVNRIVMGECGHAFRSVYDTGNRYLGWKTPPVPVVHAVEFYHEILTDKRITIKKKLDTPVTFHDPCNIVRGRGLHELAREVTRMCCTTLIEMEPNREHNFCCGAGGGVINCGPNFKNERVLGNRVKAEQLMAAKAKGADTVITPCHNCHGGLEDIIHHFGIDMKIKFLSDIIYETMEI
ncbi:electron transfer complex ferredoxin TmcB [Desulfoluna spongiiphila]|uniref:electron transfer complex ferredoxin TmcB n=1 Tax=Desulfoluna spongiiphila TaxID=419481 RepID=UPI001253780B|nr:(Fe-S)-binding protein [Desulfoluna spongiiphila]VVS91770.1 alpha-helical ferredoxin [Desulfoluna spongiiphila]